jgi:hypothetical protein
MGVGVEASKGPSPAFWSHAQRRQSAKTLARASKFGCTRTHGAVQPPAGFCPYLRAFQRKVGVVCSDMCSGRCAQHRVRGDQAFSPKSLSLMDRQRGSTVAGVAPALGEWTRRRHPNVVIGSFAAKGRASVERLLKNFALNRIRKAPARTDNDHLDSALDLIVTRLGNGANSRTR